MRAPRLVVTLVLIAAAVIVITPACTASEPPPPDPMLVIESPGSKSEEAELVVLDLSGRELIRQPIGSAQALPSLHAATAQVAFWRSGASGSSHELVVWNIATKALKVIATYANAPTASPLWSVDGLEVVSLTTTTSISYMPGATFEGRAEVSVATVATAQSRTVATARPFMPAFANAQVVAGRSFSGDERYVVVDARNGKTLSELALTGTVGVFPTANPDVIIALRETTTPGEVTRHALNARTGAELSQLGQAFAVPMPSWPGRSEIVFVAAGDLKAYDYAANSTRVVGRLEDAAAPLGFDALGRVLLAVRLTDLRYGTFTVADGRLSSAMRPIPLTSLGPPLGLVRIRL